MSTVSLQCRCGNVRGVATDVSPTSGNRIVCYCDDCQAFANFLERDDILDVAGGTDIFQIAPSQVRITQGDAELRCVRLSVKGLFRWYTNCCRTPIGNTVGPRLPFVGVIHSFMDHTRDGHTPDEVLGKPLGYIHGRFAVGGLPPHAHPRTSFGLIVRIAGRLLGWWMMGKGVPSPFFDSKTNGPRVEPRVLTQAERNALRSPG